MEKEIFLRSVRGGNGNVMIYSYTQKGNKFYCHTSCSHPDAAGLDFEVTIDEIKEAIKDTLEEIEISNSILNSLTKQAKYSIIKKIGEKPIFFIKKS